MSRLNVESQDPRDTYINNHYRKYIGESLLEKN